MHRSWHSFPELLNYKSEATAELVGPADSDWALTPKRRNQVQVSGPFYVYALKDPRQSPAKIFYIGKGVGTRAWQHLVSVDETPKGRRIADIEAEGKNVLVSVLIDALAEHQALKMEAELISALGTEANGGILTNTINPSGNRSNLRPELVMPSGVRDKASLALDMLKAAILEFAKANPTGVTNADAANSLGLKSDYAGGAKDYLTFSVIGLLVSDGKLRRDDSLGRGKYVATTR